MFVGDMFSKDKIRIGADPSDGSNDYQLGPQFTLAVTRQAHLWLLALAIVSQVVGWLFIATALPRLPAVETSVLLLVQPVFAIAWGVMLFAERMSSLQWIGSAIVLAGVAVYLILTRAIRAPLSATRWCSMGSPRSACPTSGAARRPRPGLIARGW
jgi:multidrug transporter EmrE-like cation transporter